MTDVAIGVETGQCNGAHDAPADVDDAFAIALALAAPQLDVKLIVPTFGNASLEPSIAAAADLLDVLDATVDVIPGASGPMPSPTDTPELSAGATALADLAMDVDGLHVLAMGPLTDLAALVVHRPEAAARIAQVSTLMGSLDGDPVEIRGLPVPDFNYVIDSWAVDLVLLHAPFPITAIPFRVSHTGLIATERLQPAHAPRTARGEFFATRCLPWARWWDATFDENGFHLWDAHLVRALTHPDGYVRRAIAVASSSAAPSCDHIDGVELVFTGDDGLIVDVCTDIDQGAVEALVADAIAVAELHRSPGRGPA